MLIFNRYPRVRMPNLRLGDEYVEVRISYSAMQSAAA
jgi:hypothetical protein